MPLSYVNHMAEKYGISVKEAETIWKRAKDEVGPETDDSIYWATVVTVFKRFFEKKPRH